MIVLDTQKNPYEFTVPIVSTNVGTVPSLKTHSANLFGNYMIIAFGNNYSTYNICNVFTSIELTI